VVGTRRKRDSIEIESSKLDESQSCVAEVDVLHAVRTIPPRPKATIPEDHIPQLTGEPASNEARRLEVRAVKACVRKVAIDKFRRRRDDAAEIRTAEVNPTIGALAGAVSGTEDRLAELASPECRGAGFEAPRTKVTAVSLIEASVMDDSVEDS
jgi:hypothetical protein